MSAEVGVPASVVVARLVQRYPDAQYLRLRPYLLRSEQEQRHRPAMTIDRVFRHRRDPEQLWEVPPNLTPDALVAALHRVGGNGRVVGLCSRIEMKNGRGAHALLMDFRCLKSPELLAELERACRHLGYAGWLLETKNSYHFIGDVLVDDREWLRFMGYWLLAEHLSDVPFVGHCVIEHVSCLRVTGTSDVLEPSVASRVDA
jgi:hypothetical protein